MIAAAGMGTAQAAGAPDPVKPWTTGSVEHTGPVPGGYASWKDLLLDQQKMVRAADRITAALADGGEGYAGVIAAPENRELRVYWKGKPAKAINDLVGRLRRDVAISVLPARYSARELREAARLIRAGSGTLSSIAPLQDGSGLTTSTTTLGAARTAIAGAAVPVDLEYGVRPELASRWNDIPPWYGGGAWRNAGTGAGCSTGFAVAYQGAQGIWTAGHCGNPGQGATDPTGQVIGQVSTKVASLDLLFISAGGGGRIFNNPVGNVFTEYSNPVIGTQSSYVGLFVCTSGAYSGTNCNIRVTAVGVTLSIPSVPGGSLRHGPGRAAVVHQRDRRGRQRRSGRGREPQRQHPGVRRRCGLRPRQRHLRTVHRLCDRRPYLRLAHVLLPVEQRDRGLPWNGHRHRMIGGLGCDMQ